MMYSSALMAISAYDWLIWLRVTEEKYGRYTNRGVRFLHLLKFDRHCENGLRKWLQLYTLKHLPVRCNL